MRTEYMGRNINTPGWEDLYHRNVKNPQISSKQSEMFMWKSKCLEIAKKLWKIITVQKNLHYFVSEQTTNFSIIGIEKQINEIYRTGNTEIDTKHISEFSI